MKTLDECKDWVAVEAGFKSFADYCAFGVTGHLIMFMGKAAELYATSQVSEYKERLRVEIQKGIDEMESEDDSEEMSDEEIYFGIKASKAFLELLDKTK
jgi:hypothetical protein